MVIQIIRKHNEEVVREWTAEKGHINEKGLYKFYAPLLLPVTDKTVYTLTIDGKIQTEFSPCSWNRLSPQGIYLEAVWKDASMLFWSLNSCDVGSWVSATE